MLKNLFIVFCKYCTYISNRKYFYYYLKKYLKNYTFYCTLTQKGKLLQVRDGF